MSLSLIHISEHPSSGLVSASSIVSSVGYIQDHIGWFITLNVELAGQLIVPSLTFIINHTHACVSVVLRGVVDCQFVNVTHVVYVPVVVDQVYDNVFAQEYVVTIL